MKQTLPIFLLFAIPLFCMAQNPLPRVYEYDDAGNRVVRKLYTIPNSPPAPSDSTEVTTLHSLNPEYYVEKINSVEIKIYPNPTTEKITLEIANLEALSTGKFYLYNLNGQLLQEHPVYSAATEVSLSGLAKGSYILKVFINDKTEDWKIIKQ